MAENGRAKCIHDALCPVGTAFSSSPLPRSTAGTTGERLEGHVETYGNVTRLVEEHLGTRVLAREVCRKGPKLHLVFDVDTSMQVCMQRVVRGCAGWS